MIHLGFLLILVGAAVLPAFRARRGAGLAAAVSGLALAGLAAPGAPLTIPTASQLAALPPGFLAADAALLVIGVVLAVGAALVAVADRRSVLTIAAAVPLGVGGALVLWAGSGLVASASVRGMVLAALIEIALGVGLVALGWYLRLAPAPDRAAPHPRGAIAGLVVGTLSAAVGAHASLILLGVIAATWSGHLLERRAGGSRLPMAPALALLVVPAWWLLGTIGGPEGLALSSLADLPISPAAERLLAIPLLLAGWATTGLWPLQRQLPGGLVAPAGAFLLARLVLVALPAGVEHWRPLAMPIVVLGIWHAALSGRLPRVAVGMAWVGLLAPQGGGLVGASFLLAAGLAVELTERVSALRAGRFAPAAQAIPLVAFGWGALLAVGGALHGEVVYTVAAVAALVALCGRPYPQAMIASAPSAAAPSE